ncbi:hypothetical protein G6514_007486 [Epicoccum nigrum]|nr:hypothetical protein G6514_007486 [Epicoccum nigrum]
MSTIASTPQAGTGNANGIQLEMNNSQNNTGTLPPSIQIRVVHAGPRQQYRCRLLPIEALNQGEDLMAKLRRMLQADSGRISRCITACKDAFLMRHDSLSSSAVAQLEEQTGNPTVYIEHSECNKPLTDAFHRPVQLRSASSFVLDHLKGIVGGDQLPWTVPRQALCLGKSFNGKAAFLWSCVALVLSAGAGVGVGLAIRDLRLGFAVGTGMLAVLAALQGALYWQISAATV